MQASKDGSMFITSSKDHTSMLFDSDTMDCLKKYVTERPVNSASLRYFQMRRISMFIYICSALFTTMLFLVEVRMPWT